MRTVSNSSCSDFQQSNHWYISYTFFLKASYCKLRTDTNFYLSHNKIGVRKQYTLLEKYVPQFQFQENTLALSLLFCMRRLLCFYLHYILLTHPKPRPDNNRPQWTCLNFTALNWVYLLYQTNWTTNEDTSLPEWCKQEVSRSSQELSFGEKLKIITFIIRQLAPPSVCGLVI